MKALALAWALAAPLALPGAAAYGPPLTLDQAIDLAVRRSKGAQLAELKVEEADSGADAARRLRYPQVSALGVGAYLADPLEAKIDEGSLTGALDQVGVQLGMSGLTSALGPFPASDLTLARGNHTPAVGGLTLLQPLSQLWRIESGVRAANAGQSEARREADRTTSELRYSVEELFAGGLLENERIAEKEAMLAYQEHRLRDAENARKVGELLDESVLGLRAAAVEAKADLARNRQQAERLSLELADLIGRPGDDHLNLTGDLPKREEYPLDYWTAQAANNPDSRIAAATVDKASAAVRASRQSRIPDVSLFAGGYAQEGIPLASNYSGVVGLTLNWDAFDFGRRDADITRALVRHRAAQVNRDRVEEDAARQIRLAYQDFVYAGELTDLAEQALAYRRRAAELSHQSASNGLALETAAADADAQFRKAEVDLVSAQLQRHLALLRLYFLSGKL
jgi:outer membrane protein TolC